MLKSLFTGVLCAVMIFSTGLAGFGGMAHAEETGAENRRGSTVRKGKTVRKSKQRKRKKRRIRRRSRRIRQARSQRLIKRRPRRGKKQINPYFLRRAKSYPGLVNGYLPGHRKKTRIPFTARDGIAYFEGDIVLGSSKDIGKRLAAKPKRRRTKGARGSVQSNIDYLWPGGVIPYLIDGPMKNYRRTMEDIESAIAELNQKTHLRIVPWSNEDNYVKIVVSDGCSSWVGMQGGMQEINLAPWTKHADAYCGRDAIIHEFLHAAGLWHTQSRPDRAKHVTVHHRNIEADFRHNFVRRNDLSYSDWLSGLGGKKVGTYEVSSIMHYGSGYFAKDFWGCVGPDDRGGDLSLCSLLTRDGAFIPTKRELTGNDVRIINTIYPERTAENDEIEALRRRCKLAVRKFCRTADDVVSCLIDARQEKAKAQPGEPFGDSNACRAQLKRLATHPDESNRPSNSSGRVQSAALVKLNRYCPKSIQRFCRRSQDIVQCLLKAKARRAKVDPKRPFGDNNRCRKQLAKMAD